MSTLKEAATRIRLVSDLPWGASNENWGAEGVTQADARLLYDDAGFKNWKWDYARGWEHLWRGLVGRRDSVQITRRSLSKNYFHRLIEHWDMAWYYFFQANELNRPDAKVSGTTVYGVWAEEAWHVALWSPLVALAVADWLESADDGDEHAHKVADLILGSGLFRQEKNDDEV